MAESEPTLLLPATSSRVTGALRMLLRDCRELERINQHHESSNPSNPYC